MANNSKRRGFNPVIAFILGFLFGLIFLIGAVAGAVFLALNYKLDKLEFNKDGDGNYIYINADPENGGVSTVLELVKKVAEIAGSPGELTVGEVENLLPVTDSIVTSMTEALEKYVEIDKEEFKQVKFGAMGEYLGGVIKEVRPAALLEEFGIDVSDNKILELVVYGKEADYVEGGGLKIPVYYDTYTAGDAGFIRKGDGAVLSAGLEQYLVEKGEEYRLYFYSYQVARSSGCFVTFKDDGGNYAFIPEEEYSYVVGENTATLSGNYYREGENKVEVEPITIGSISDGSALSALDEISVTEFVDESDDLTNEILGGVTVGDLINGNVNFQEIIDGIEVADFMDVAPSDSIMAFIAFGITEISQENGTYTALYHPEEGETRECVLTVEDDVIKEVVLSGGESVPQTGIKDVSHQVSRLTQTLKLKDVITIDQDDKVMSKLGEYIIDEVGSAVDDLTLDDFMEVELTHEDGKLALTSADSVLAYVVYGLTDIREEGNIVTAVYNPVGSEAVQEKKHCTVETADGKISNVYITQTGEKVTGTTVKNVSDRVEGVTRDLKIGSLIGDVSNNKLLNSIKNSTIESLSDDINNLSVNELYAEDIYSVRDENGNVTEQAKLKNSAEIEYSQAYLYYKEEDGEFKLVEGVTEEQFNTGNYYTYGEAQGTWKLLLYAQDEGGVKREHAYSVNAITELMNNVTDNTEETTLKELTDAGMLSMTAEQLATPFDGKTVGDLTLFTALEEFVKVLNELQKIQG